MYNIYIYIDTCIYIYIIYIYIYICMYIIYPLLQALAHPDPTGPVGSFPLAALMPPPRFDEAVLPGRQRAQLHSLPPVSCGIACGRRRRWEEGPRLSFDLGKSPSRLNYVTMVYGRHVCRQLCLSFGKLT